MTIFKYLGEEEKTLNGKRNLVYFFFYIFINTQIKEKKKERKKTWSSFAVGKMVKILLTHNLWKYILGLLSLSTSAF